jgi:3-deoxy-7-phosphoheptulonate synthase
MLVVMQQGASQGDIDRVISTIEELGYEARPMPGAQRTAVGLVGNDGRVDGSRIEALPGVAQVIHVSQPYKQVSREWRQENTIVEIAPGVAFGGKEVPIIAGPCSVESEEQILASAHAVRAAGGTALRGGAFKPRSSPYAFQGMGLRGLELLALARSETGLAIVTEAMDEEGANLVAKYADCIQIGARNMQNYSLLRAVGRIGKPVLLKRGMAATISDLLLSAEYILAEGNQQVILCERGVRSFDTVTRNMFDLTAIPIVHKLSHRTARQGEPDGSRRSGRGRGWHTRRNASQPRPRPLRWRAVALPGAVLGARNRAACDCRGHRAGYSRRPPGFGSFSRWNRGRPQRVGTGRTAVRLARRVFPGDH